MEEREEREEVSRTENGVEIEELSGSDEVVNGPEPVITENDEISEPPVIEGTEAFSNAHSVYSILRVSNASYKQNSMFNIKI